MLKVFRDNLKNLAWILWVIIALFVLALAADFGASVRGARQRTLRSPRWAASQVSQQEFQRAYKNMTNFYRQIYGDQLTPEIEKQMYRQALSQTVVQKILLAEARRLGLRVTDAELRDRILSIPELQGRAGALHRRGGLQADARGQPDQRRRLRDRAARRAAAEEAQRRPRRQPLRQRGRDPAGLPRPGRAREDPLRPAAAGQLRRAGGGGAAGRGRGVLPGPQGGVQAARAARRGLPAGRRPPSSPARCRSERAGPPGLVRRPQGRVHPGGPGAGPPHPGDGQRPAQRRAGAGPRRWRRRRSSTAAPTSPPWPRRTPTTPPRRTRAATSATSAATRWSRSSRTRPSAPQPGKVVGPVKSSFGYHLLEVTGKRPGGTQPFERGQGADPRPPHRRAHPAARRDPRQGARHPPRREQAGQRRGPEGPRRPEPGRDLRPRPRSAPPIRCPASAPPSTPPPSRSRRGRSRRRSRCRRAGPILYVKDVVAPHAPELKEVEPRVQAALVTQKLQQMATQKLQEAAAQMPTGKTLDQVAAELGVQVKETAGVRRPGSDPRDRLQPRADQGGHGAPDRPGRRPGRRRPRARCSSR